MRKNWKMIVSLIGGLVFMFSLIAPTAAIAPSNIVLGAWIGFFVMGLLATRATIWIWTPRKKAA